MILFLNFIISNLLKKYIFLLISDYFVPIFLLYHLKLLLCNTDHQFFNRFYYYYDCENKYFL